MHQIRFRLGLPHWGSLQRYPRPSNWILGALLLREVRGEGREGRGKGREGALLLRKGKWGRVSENGRRGREKEGQGQGGEGIRDGRGREGREEGAASVHILRNDPRHQMAGYGPEHMQVGLSGLDKT